MSNQIFNARVDLMSSTATVDPTIFTVEFNVVDGTGQFAATDVEVGDVLYLDTFIYNSTISKYTIHQILGAVGTFFTGQITYVDTGAVVDPGTLSLGVGSANGFICRTTLQKKFAWFAAPTVHTFSDYITEYARDQEHWAIVENMSVTGPQGLQGIQGTQGIQGIQGVAGVVGSTGPVGLAGSTGPAGLVGSTGLIGSTGLAGSAGVAGSTGPAGLAGSTGPAGLAGSTGPAGLAGSTGPAGLAGSIGPAGLAGSTGPAGLAGSTGPAGLAGSTGPAGLAGSTGPAGLAGSTGPAGLAGSTGPAGLAGSTGPVGLAGSTGPVGLAGSTGPVGLAGSTGPLGPIGVTGFGIQGTTGLLGGQGLTGPVGLQGTTGYAGTSEGVRTLTYFGGDWIVRAAGDLTQLPNIVVTKDFTVTATSRCILTVPEGVEILEVHGTFTAAETVGRTALTVELPDPAGSSSMATSYRPFGVRYNSTWGIVATNSTITNNSGILVVTLTSYTAATDQKVSVWI